MVIRTIDDLDWWTMNLPPIYKAKLAGRTPTDVWSKVAEHGSGVGEAVREASFEQLVSRLAQAMGWVLIFFDQARNGTWPGLDRPFKEAGWDGSDFGSINSLGEVVLYHYPKICPHCLGDKCKCVLGTKPSKEQRLDALEDWRHRNRADFDRTWYQLEDRFGDLYKHDDRIKSHADIGFHFLEEIGEVGKALRMVARVNGGAAISGVESPTTRTVHGQLVEEIADVISWSTSVIRRVKLDLENYCKLCPQSEVDSLRGLLSLKWALEFTYLDKGALTSPVCPKCRYSPCKPECDEF